MSRLALLALAAALGVEAPAPRPTEPPRSVARIQSEAVRHSRLSRRYVEARDEYQGSLKLTRPALLRELESILAEGPNNGLAKMIRRECEILRQMIEEDRTIGEAPLKHPLDSRERRDESIAWLIHQLRDEIHQNTTDPGPHPSRTLMDLGLEAVPHLLARIDDERRARGGNCTVGESCRNILSQIAGIPANRSGPWPQIKDWWSDVQQHGEESVLLDLMWQGRESPSSLRWFATKYATKYSRAAVRDFAKFLPSLQSGGEMLIMALDEIADEELVHELADDIAAILRRQLKSPSAMTRVAAARSLLARGHDDGVPVIFHEWERLPREWYDGNLAYALIEQLVKIASDESIAALREGVRKRPTCRIYFINVLQYTRDPDPARVSSPRIERAIDDIVLDLFQDHSVYNGRADDPRRICDLAAQLLAARWEMAEAFEMESSLALRDCQIQFLQVRRAEMMDDAPREPARLEKQPTQLRLSTLVEPLRPHRNVILEFTPEPLQPHVARAIRPVFAELFFGGKLRR